jgi:hypothetical protein
VDKRSASTAKASMVDALRLSTLLVISQETWATANTALILAYLGRVHTMHHKRFVIRCIKCSLSIALI